MLTRKPEEEITERDKTGSKQFPRFMDAKDSTTQTRNNSNDDGGGGDDKEEEQEEKEKEETEE